MVHPILIFGLQKHVKMERKGFGDVEYAVANDLQFDGTNLLLRNTTLISFEVGFCLYLFH